MKIGKGTCLPKIFVTWPHKISIGKNCRLEHHIYFHHDGIWSAGYSIEIGDNVFIGSGCEFNIICGVKIGKYSNIASGCKFIYHDHGYGMGKLIGSQPPVKKEIILEDDVWLGCNVVVLKFRANELIGVLNLYLPYI
jgi:acetyltransferase-like isoleucine patch superfamily enzyme